MPPPSYVFAPYWTEVTDDFTTRLLNFQHIYVTRFDSDNFVPMYVGGPGMEGSDTPITRFDDAGIALTKPAPHGTEAMWWCARWLVETPNAAQLSCRCTVAIR
ncbi:MAG: hypothetical protein U0694_07550 [Anaerolineae bacterium]